MENRFGRREIEMQELRSAWQTVLDDFMSQDKLDVLLVCDLPQVRIELMMSMLFQLDVTGPDVPPASNIEGARSAMKVGVEAGSLASRVPGEYCSILQFREVRAITCVRYAICGSKNC